MQKLALGAFVALLVACGSSTDNKVHIVTDSGGGSGSDSTCNPLAQTGCATGEKCTWVYDLVSSDGLQILGHVGCAPEGDKAVGAQCTRNAAGAQGWDDCTKAGFCKAKRELVGPGGQGVCEQICDNNGGDPMCGANAHCVAYHNIFEVSTMNVAGVCDVKCDPFADNDFNHEGSGAVTRPGTQCQSYEGCYGYPGKTTIPTSFSCAREYNTDLHNRNECTDSSGNSLSNANPLSRVACASASNGCSQGQMPLLIEATGSMTAICVSMCKPKSCWMGNCGGSTSVLSNLTGDPADPGNQCQATARKGFLNPAIPNGGNNGDQCVFNWQFEITTQNQLLTSPYDDTLGWCEDHSQYKYDKDLDGMITAADDEAEPQCDSMSDPGFGTGSADPATHLCTPGNGCRGAGSFGCTSVVDSGLLTFKNRPLPSMPVRAHHIIPYGYKTQL